jgi:hypothetical protein
MSWPNNERYDYKAVDYKAPGRGVTVERIRRKISLAELFAGE